MKTANRKNGDCLRLIVAAAFFAVLLFPFSATFAFGQSSELSATTPDMLREGERIYREGILPSGKPVLTAVKGEPAIPGTNFACGSCHLRSGLGALDENVYSPPVTGKKLFLPLYRLYKGIEQTQTPPLRPAYTDETLIAAIRTGIDPAGRVLSAVMPRYILEDRDALILVAYLKALSSQFSPGVTDTTLRFATVITDDATPEESDAMLSSLEAYFQMQNRRVAALKAPRRASSRLMAEKMIGSGDLTERRLLLSRWLLKGPPNTWRGQMEEYNRKEPVFALLGGITKGDWKPIHQFSETHGIPCLFPNTDFPVIGNTDWYTLYLSKGYYQEGEGAARYLDSKGALIKGKPIIQIVRASREGEALAAGFQQTWRDLGHEDPTTITLPPEKTLNAGLLMRVLSKKKSAVLMVWDDAKALPALESLSGKANKPKMVFVSSGYLGKGIWTLKETIRDFTYITYPFSFSPYVPKNSGMGAAQKTLADPRITLKQADLPFKDNRQKITALTDGMTRLLTSILMDMRGQYFRDNFLDVVGTMMDLPYPLYGQLSFGAGKRYASRGCYIVQLSRGNEPELVKRSDWEIH